MQKIIVIGCPGAGKSTFSKALQDKLGLSLFHLDMLFWNADRTNVSREEFDRKLSHILKQDKWIIDGNYGRTLEIRLKKCDTVFLLDFPVSVCLSGVESRIGKPREDMPWIEQEFDAEFKEWIINFPKKELPHVYELLEKHKDKNVIIFKSHNEIDEFLGKLKIAE